MEKVLNLYKPQCFTPLEAIEFYRRQYPEYKNVKMAYAGRLDPMAHGVLLVLVGEECKRRELYQNLEKEYEFEVLFGVKTDTYDTLGLLKSLPKTLSNNAISISQIESYLKKIEGNHLQTYPPYSSKTVKGKKLFQWARANRLSEIQIPKKEVKIRDIKLLGEKIVKKASFQRQIINNIKKVNGSFRQAEIISSWGEFFKVLENLDYNIWRFSVAVSTGTYIRSIINEMGLAFGVGAIAIDIKRTRVGDYFLSDSIIIKNSKIDE